jgi:hypothetical protein
MRIGFTKYFIFWLPAVPVVCLGGLFIFMFFSKDTYPLSEAFFFLFLSIIVYFVGVIYSIVHYFGKDKKAKTKM